MDDFYNGRLKGVPSEEERNRRPKNKRDRLFLERIFNCLFNDEDINIDIPIQGTNTSRYADEHYDAFFAAIDRHRLGTDGEGITTLVVFHGCPLHCKYCINKKILYQSGMKQRLTSEELYRLTRKDDLYFRATRGGITFGGGEPAMYSKFIEDFRIYCGDSWKLNIETSLNVEKEHIERLLPVIDCYIIDIKDMDKNRYEKYTGKNNILVIENLRLLLKAGMRDRMRVRVPLITGYNTESDVQENVRILREMGITHIEQFKYKVV